MYDLFFLSSFLLCTTSLCALNLIRNRRSDEQRRIGTDDHTHEKREYEALDGLTTEDKDSEQYDERTHRGRERTAERVVQRVVDVHFLLALRIESVVLTNTVEDDHGIVDRVTDNGQDSCDECLIKLHGERHDLPPDSIQTKDDHGIVSQSGQCTNRVSEVTESEQDVKEDHYESCQDCPNGTGLDIVCNRRTNLF